MKFIYTGLVAFFASSAVMAQTFINFSINQAPPLIVDAGAGSDICDGAAANLSGSTSGGNGSNSYQWSPSGSVVNPTNISSLASPTTTTVYTLTITDGNQCSQTDTVVVALPANPLLADAGNGATICPGSNVNLAGIGSGGYGSYSYLWSPGSTLSDSTNQSTTATPIGTITYYFVVTDLNNCEAEDSIVVTVLDCSGIEDQTNGSIYTTYPNPSNGTFNITIGNLQPGDGDQIKIFGMNGSCVYQRNIMETGNYQVQLPEVAKGIYMIVLYHQEKPIQAQKISIQ